ncbi:hypothetical protein BBP40_005774 [Aspergillus hancockii]|nr:hypothetical protein BBP40_005774 [Aspergillus hancockii]
MPTKEVSDRLIQAYIRTFETIYRIVHVPSFLREYDQHWTILKQQAQRSLSELFSCLQLTWVTSPFEKSRLNVPSLQIHCLLLLARQVAPVSSDLVWVSAGTLLRTAMHMGLHIDPRHIKSIAIFDAELRRRMWSAILEVVVQTSMDAGALPLISGEHYDCEPPLNIDDAQLEDQIPRAKPLEQFTDTSLQRELRRPLPIRLQIAQFVNDFRRGVSYDEALRLSKRLTNIYRETSTLFQSFNPNELCPTPFQLKLHDLMIQRFLLALHDPFAVRAKINPTFYYSQKIALETSMRILGPLNASTQQDQDYTALLLAGSPSFRDAPTQAAAVVADDLIHHLKEAATSLDSVSYPISRRDLRRVLGEYLRHCTTRLESGEMNIKGYLMPRCFWALSD